MKTKKKKTHFSGPKSIKELTEINKEPSKSLPLVLRHDHYAGDIVLLLAKLFLREGDTDQVCQSSAEAGNLLHLPLSLSKAVHVQMHATHRHAHKFSLRSFKKFHSVLNYGYNKS